MAGAYTADGTLARGHRFERGMGGRTGSGGAQTDPKRARLLNPEMRKNNAKREVFVRVLLSLKIGFQEPTTKKRMLQFIVDYQWLEVTFFSRRRTGWLVIAPGLEKKRCKIPA